MIDNLFKKKRGMCGGVLSIARWHLWSSFCQEHWSVSLQAVHSPSQTCLIEHLFILLHIHKNHCCPTSGNFPCFIESQVLEWKGNRPTVLFFPQGSCRPEGKWLCWGHVVTASWGLGPVPHPPGQPASWGAESETRFLPWMYLGYGWVSGPKQGCGENANESDKN